MQSKIVGNDLQKPPIIKIAHIRLLLASFLELPWKIPFLQTSSYIFIAERIGVYWKLLLFKPTTAQVPARSLRAGIAAENPQGCGGTEQTEDLQRIARPFRLHKCLNQSTKFIAKRARQIKKEKSTSNENKNSPNKSSN